MWRICTATRTSRSMRTVIPLPRWPGWPSGSGFKAIGIVDFDVLDGVEEFLTACDMLAVRGSAGLETRVFVPEFATREINSPGELGIAYHMGIGFTSPVVPRSVAHIQEGMRNRAAQRNREIITRINDHLHPVSIDYDRDVLPLTPAGNATERHVLVAYVKAAEQTVPDPVEFWAERLDLPVEQVRPLIGDAPRFQNLIRLKLINAVAWATCSRVRLVSDRRSGQCFHHRLRRFALLCLAGRDVGRRTEHRGIVGVADQQGGRRAEYRP